MFDAYKRKGLSFCRRNYRYALSPLRDFYILTGSLPRAYVRGYLLPPLCGSLGRPV